MRPAASAATHKIPAVVYGHGNDPIHLTLPGHDTMMALKHGGANALLELDIDGKAQLALAREVQVDPVRRVLEHIDFVAVRKGEKVTVDVPVHVVGDAVSETLVVTENSTVQVEAEATNIPEYIEVSVEGAEVGTQIHASDLRCPRAPRCSSTRRRWSSTSPRRSPPSSSRPSCPRPRPRPASSTRRATRPPRRDRRRRRGRDRPGRGRLRRVTPPRRPGWLRRRGAPTDATPSSLRPRHD